MTEASGGGDIKKNRRGKKLKKKPTRPLSLIDSSLLLPTPTHRGKGWEMPHILPEERGPPASCSEVAPPAPSAPSGPRGRSPPVIPGARGKTPGGSAAQRARRPARLPLERERDGEAGGSSPAGSRGGRSPRSASRGFPARRPLHRTWPDNGNEGERQGEGNTSSLQTSCRMSRLGAGWRKDPRSSDYPARTFDAWHTDTHSRRRRRRSEARAPPHPAAPRRGGTAGARTFPRDAVVAHMPLLRLHSHFRGHVRGGRARR